MKKPKSDAQILILLLCSSAIIYAIQLLLFEKPQDTEFYILQDCAFLPLQVALVTVVLGKELGDREKRQHIEKLGMVISAFFSEAGLEVLTVLARSADDPESFRPALAFTADWSERDFRRAALSVRRTKPRFVCRPEELAALKSLLTEKRECMLGMLENPTLMEHDGFTDMLLAVFHLTEELLAREDLARVTGADAAHLSGDMERAFHALAAQWLQHTSSLQKNYPYLFSLEARRNPFGCCSAPVE